jgi:ribosomal peptide maturation radical SAM protein 1
MGYRQKSVNRTVRELEYLHSRWNENSFQATDNILWTAGEENLLSEIERVGLRIELFFEVKANLRESQLDQFVRAGVTAIQPGIESLSDEVLRKMRKGLSAVQAIALLRNCSARNISVYWNFLTELPDDDDSDYQGLAEVIPKLVHLCPPTEVGPVRIDRFSPYHSSPGSFNIKELRPIAAYSKIFPKSANLNDIAYHFEYRRTVPTTSNSFRQLLIDAANEWRAIWQRGSGTPILRLVSQGDSDAVMDSRTCKNPSIVALSRVELDVLRLTSRGVPRARLSEYEGVLERLLAESLVVELGNRVVSLVVEPAPVDSPGALPRAPSAAVVTRDLRS